MDYKPINHKFRGIWQFLKVATYIISLDDRSKSVVAIRSMHSMVSLAIIESFKKFAIIT